jgi:hypothetical protein
MSQSRDERFAGWTCRGDARVLLERLVVELCGKVAKRT